MSDCSVTPSVAQTIWSQQQNMLVGDIVRQTIANVPYISLLKSGIYRAGLSQSVRSVLEEQGMPVASLTAPTFVPLQNAVCPPNASDTTGKTEFSYSLGVVNGKGPKVFLDQAFYGYANSLVTAYNAIADQIKGLINADIRYQLYSQSGTKAVVNSTGSWENLVTGGIGQRGVSFASYTPDTRPSWEFIYRAVSFLTEEMRARSFGSGRGEHFKLIASKQLARALRNDAGVHQDLGFLATGQDELGIEGLKGYAFEGPYQGVLIGVDQQPLRLDANLNPVEPLVSTSVTVGLAGRPNQNWISTATAPYEVAFLVGADSFVREVPAEWTGEGEFKWAKQLFGGQLKWFVPQTEENAYQNYGYHVYRIGRAFRPQFPHFVMPILFKRCYGNLGLSACSTSVGNSA